MAHANAQARTCWSASSSLVLMIDQGMSEGQAAAALSVSPRTAHRWKQRWLDATPPELRVGRLGAGSLQRGRTARRAQTAAASSSGASAPSAERTGWGPRLIAGTTGDCALDRSRDPAPPRPVARSRRRRARRSSALSGPARAICCRWTPSAWPASPGPGIASPAIRYRTGAEKRARVGWEFCHSIIDDHTRIAYTELHRDENAATVVAFVERALTFFASLGIHARRLQTDNAWTYTHNNAAARAARRARASATARSRRARPSATAKSSATSRPSPANGPTASATAQATPEQQRCHTGSSTTTTARPHSEIGNRPPISRAPNLPGQDS